MVVNYFMLYYVYISQRDLVVDTVAHELPCMVVIITLSVAFIFSVKVYYFSNNSPFFLFQADVCHAYQILKRGGVKDENIVVFMYDDIAYNEENPRPGVIINSPHGSDVYKGVPKV